MDQGGGHLLAGGTGPDRPGNVRAQLGGGADGGDGHQADELALGDVEAVTDIEAATAWGKLPAGNTVEIGDPLFPRLDMDAIDLSME